MNNLFYSIIILLYSHNIVFSQTNFLVFNPEQINNIKTAVIENDQEIKSFVEELREFADFAIDKGPWSVTFHKGKAISGDPHDYYSEGPNWWPDPDNRSFHIKKGNHFRLFLSVNMKKSKII